MQSPALYETTAFDAIKDWELFYRWNGSQSRGSILNIYDNTTNHLVYTGTNTTMKLSHTIPAGSLQNGRCYNAALQVINKDKEIISGKSNTIVFWCFTTPIFRIKNLTDNTIVEKAGCDVEIEYLQPEGELLSQYQISLCDLGKNPLQSRGIQYVTSPAETISASLSPLEDNTSYYIHATGKTLNGMQMETGYLLIQVHYIQPSMFSWIELSNNKQNGYIYITSNLIAIRGKSNPPEEELEFIDGTVDITGEGNRILFDEGFSLEGNGLIGVSYLGAAVNQAMLRFGDGTQNAVLYYRQGRFSSEEEQGYFELQVDFPLGHMICTSQYLPPVSENQAYTLWITKKDHLYRIDYRKGDK